MKPCRRLREAASAADYERIAQTMAYDSERAMFEAYGKNKYVSTGVIQWMLNNAWPSMIWHLYDYYLDAGAGYFATKKACEPLHIQYSYDDRSIVVVNSTYAAAGALQASVQRLQPRMERALQRGDHGGAGADSAQRVFTIPENLYSGAERIFFIDLTLTDAAGQTVSRNFYWVPDTLTTFDWEKTDYTHTPAARHEDLTALAHLPAASVDAHAELATTARGRELSVHLNNKSKRWPFRCAPLCALRPATLSLLSSGRTTGSS